MQEQTKPAPQIAAEKVEVIRHDPPSIGAGQAHATPEAAKAAVHGISGEGLDTPAPQADKPVDINFARTTFESVKVMVGNAKDNEDIDTILKGNTEGLKNLERASAVNYGKLKAIVTARRQELKVDTFVDDFVGGDEIPA